MKMEQERFLFLAEANDEASRILFFDQARAKKASLTVAQPFNCLT